MSSLPPLVVPGLPALSDREFALFAAFIRREAGIALSDAKRTLLVGRLARRLRELGVPSFGHYLRIVESDPDERMQMLDCISTHETHFFREPRHFDFLREVLFPAWRARWPRGRRIRVWSAGCSTGEEPYSLAMTLLDGLPPEDGWRHEILATDLSTRRPRERARRRVAGGAHRRHPARAPQALHARRRRPQGRQRQGRRPSCGAITLSPRSTSTTRSIPSADRTTRSSAATCSSTSTPSCARRVVRQLDGHLAADGHLFVGHAESLHGLTTLGSAAPTMYSPAT